MSNPRALASDQTARRAYFADPAHVSDRLWIGGGAPHGIDFGYLERETGLQVVDFFAGRLPYFCDARNPDGQGVELSAYLTLVLDSNIAGDLLAYIEGNMRHPDARAQVERFLQWFASTPCMNLTPAFNLIERFAQSTDPVKAESMAFRTSRTSLDVVTMDRAYYLATGTIRAAADAAEILKRQSGTSDFDAVARKAVTDTARVPQSDLDAFYAFLLEVALIGAKRRRPTDFVPNVEELIAFVEQRFGVAGPLEFGAALLHFARLLPKFVDVNSGMTFDQVTSRIRHSAWDMAYLRTPTMFLKTSTPQSTTIPFVLTADQDAADVLRLAQFQMLLVTPQKAMPFVAVDTANVRERFNRNAIFDEGMGRVKTFFSRRPAQPVAPDLPNVIANLHRDLTTYFSGRSGTSRTS